MALHIVDMEKCCGCGKCVDNCGLELLELIDWEDGTRKVRAVEEAAEICNCCKCCQDACLENALEVRDQ